MATQRKQGYVPSKRMIEYSEFGNSYIALAVMIFAQAYDDAVFLKRRKTERKFCSGYSGISKWEIVNFLRSDWAKFLASAIDVTDAELHEIECFVIG